MAVQFRAMWLTRAGDKRLALVKRDVTGYVFGGWVEADVQAFAISKTEAEFGSVSFMREDAVEGVE